MIKTQKEYDQALVQYQNNAELIDQTKNELAKEGLDADQIQRALQGICAKNADLKADLDWYQDAINGRFAKYAFTDAGKLAIAMRIFKKMTQKELAEKIGMTPGNFSRLEANQYFSANKSTFEKVFEALEYQVSLSAQSKVS